MKYRIRGSLVALTLLVFVSCSNDGKDRVLVLAASSLSDAFQEMETAFEAANPTIDIQLNLAGSSALREQILDGAAADVFAAADQTTMQQVADEVGVVGRPQAFAANQLVIVMPIDNPGQVVELADLARQDLLVGLCASEVPCGNFARMALAQVDVQPSIDTDEPNVRSLLGKVIAGELDVGIVYASDVVSGPALQIASIAMPPTVDVDIVYPIAELAEAENSAGAQAFTAFVLSAEGRAILTSHGFDTP